MRCRSGTLLAVNETSAVSDGPGLSEKPSWRGAILRAGLFESPLRTGGPDGGDQALPGLPSRSAFPLRSKPTSLAAASGRRCPEELSVVTYIPG